MKVIAIKTLPRLSGIFSNGDVLELTSVLYEEDTKVQNEVYGKNMGKEIGWVILNSSKLDKKHLPEGVVKIFDEVIAKKGTYKGYKIENLSLKNGKIYTDRCMQNLVGYITLDKLFRKI